MWKHRWLTMSLCAAFLLVASNIVAFNQAWSMTHFRDSGSRTATPEALSFIDKLCVTLVGVSIPRPTNTIDPGSIGLEFETHKFGGPGSNDLEAWFIPIAIPKGLVLLAHGYGACKASLLPSAKVFHDWGYSTLLLDFRGSGGSRGAETSIGVRESDDIAAAVIFSRTLVPNRPLILYGQSMGSAAILRAIAINDVRPSAVIVECPFDKLISTASNRFAAMGLPAFPFAHMLVFWGGVQQGFDGFRHNPSEYAQFVSCPVLLLQGKKDPRVTVAQSESIFQNLQGEKTLTLFPNVGHESCLAADSQLWERSVSAFLEKLAARP